MNNIKKEILEIVGACDLAFASTINWENFPETRALVNDLNKKIADIANLYFTSDIDSPKVEQIKKNSCASLYYFVPKTMKNMTLFGKFKLVTDKSLKDALWRDEFSKYYENGKEDEKYCVLNFIPTGYKYYTFKNGDYSKNEGNF
ncbi:MAG: pyridoxamine 5'-phosphate oxidase family protein [Holosporaceae bacterium]|jgi:general stress protein 26|nr:pyridoxamine 5'-phosphate oxidase family protein [Holosporaceae bacterium]